MSVRLQHTAPLRGMLMMNGLKTVGKEGSTAKCEVNIALILCRDNPQNINFTAEARKWLRFMYDLYFVIQDISHQSWLFLKIILGGHVLVFTCQRRPLVELFVTHNSV